MTRPPRWHQAPSRRWRTVLLLAWLPLVKVALPPGLLRLVLFHGGGTLLAVLAVRGEGDAPAVRPLLARPWRGLWDGLLGYALLVGVAVFLVYVPYIQPVLPYAVYDLAALFDPLPVYLAFARGDPWPPGMAIAVLALGSLAEEWIFRVALFWRWLPAATRGTPAGTLALLLRPGTWVRLVLVSAFFAALHWPQAPGQLAVAFLGSLALGSLLLWSRSYAEIATLHVLFNWRLLF